MYIAEHIQKINEQQIGASKDGGNIGIGVDRRDREPRSEPCEERPPSPLALIRKTRWRQVSRYARHRRVLDYRRGGKLAGTIKGSISFNKIKGSVLFNIRAG
jgi:hypothetical protein